MKGHTAVLGGKLHGDGPTGPTGACDGGPDWRPEDRLYWDWVDNKWSTKRYCCRGVYNDPYDGPADQAYWDWVKFKADKEG